MKQTAIHTIFFFVCCLLVALSPSLAATTKRNVGDVGFALFKASSAHPVSGAVTFAQLDGNIDIFGQFNTGFTDDRSFHTCKLLVLTNPQVDLTPFVVNTAVQNGGTAAFRFTLTRRNLRTFRNKRLIVRCGTKTIGSARITVIP